MRTSTWRTAVMLRASKAMTEDELPPRERGAWMLLLVALFVRTPGPFLGQGLDQALDQYAAFMRLS